MPTINYAIKLICANCGKRQTHKLPVGSEFVEAYYSGVFISGTQWCTPSGYHKNYNKDAHKTIKRCVNCRAAALQKDF